MSEDTPLPITTEILDGEIVDWTDGDTVKAHTRSQETHVMYSGGKKITTTVTVESVEPESFRLTIIDTPERGEPGYREATAYAEAVLPVGSLCTIETHGVDNGGWGRTLGNVFPIGSRDSMSERLLRNGYAKVWTPR